MNTAATFALVLALPGLAFAQSPASGTEAAPRAQIRLGPEKKAPATQPAPAPAPATGAPAPAAVQPAPPQNPPASSSATPVAPSAETEPFEQDVVPESPESEAGKQPSPGLGPAPATSAESDAALMEPRVIDTSKPDAEDPADLPPPEPEPHVDGNALPFTHHVRHLDVALGLRVVGTTNDGLEPYLYDPVLADVFLRAGGAFALTDRIGLALLGEVGTANASATVRDLSSGLSKTHLTLGVEGRYHFHHRMYAYGRVAPGLEFVNAQLDLPNAGELSDDSLGFQVDGSAGLALRVAGASDGSRRTGRFWIFAEGGYRVGTKHKLSLQVDEDVGPARAEAVEMAPLNLSGGFGTLGALLTF